MTIFGVPEARHFCSNFQGTAGASTGSLMKYVAATLQGVSVLKEGTQPFESYRDCLLREAERFVFLGISNYRRSLDLMMPGASSWAHVTLYYSSYFAARALLAMFGGWVGTKTVVDVITSQPGNQELAHRKESTTYKGSHERFWELFYGAVAALTYWVDPRFRFAITPVNGIIPWQTQVRNEINYDSFSSCQLSIDFQTIFKVASFPASLPGTLNTQFSVSQGLLVITSGFARQFNLSTDALSALRPSGPRKGKIERLVDRSRAPRLVRRTWWKTIVK